MKVKRKKDLPAIVPVILFLMAGVAVYFYGNFKSSREYYNAAEKSLENKDFYYASEYLKNALHFDPSYTRAYVLYAKIYSEALNDPAFALQILNQALARDAINGAGYYIMGKSKLKQAYDKKEIISDFEKALTLEPELDSAAFFIATLKEQTRDFEGALESYNLALAKFPDSDNLILGKARCLYHLGNYRESASVLDKILNIGKNGEAFFFRASCYLQLNQREKACVDFANAYSNNYDIASASIEKYCLQDTVTY